MTTIGIDFGTTNSVVAAWAGIGPDVVALSKESAPYQWQSYGYAPVMPSVFASDGGEATFGFDALASPGGRFEAVKRLFTVQEDVAFDSRGQSLMVEEVATLLFAELLRRTREEGVDAKRAVVTVPANSRGLARHRTKICAGMSGVQVLSLINEPTAAALSYAAGRPGDQTVLVFDWGGGTLDVTVLRSLDGVFIEEASSGLPRRGGRDFDARLRRLVVDAVPEAESWTALERDRANQELELAKIALSTSDEVTVQLPGGIAHRVTRAAFNEATRSLVEQARQPIEQCFADVGITPADIDALVLVGGTSAIPAVRTMVTEIVGREPEPGVNPLTAVAEGAAIAAAVLSGEAGDRYDLLVSIEHALGTVVLDPETFGEEFSVLIERNQLIPTERKHRYVPVFEGQEEVRIQVIEGDPSKPVDDPDSVILAEFDVSLDPDAEDPGFDLTYKYDVNGILTVDVERSDGAITTESIGFGPSGLDKQAMVDIARRAKRVVQDREVTAMPVGGSDDPEADRWVQIALAKVIPFLDDAEARPLQELVAAVQQATDPDERAKATAALEDALIPYSYLF